MGIEREWIAARARGTAGDKQAAWHIITSAPKTAPAAAKPNASTQAATKALPKVAVQPVSAPRTRPKEDEEDRPGCGGLSLLLGGQFALRI